MIQYIIIYIELAPGKNSLIIIKLFESLQKIASNQFFRIEKTMIDQIKIKITPEEMGIIARTIGFVTIHEIDLQDFHGQVQGCFLAHIYWQINYKFVSKPPTNKEFYPFVVTQPSISSRSWVNKKHVSKDLIRHQYGHYLIACWCSLQYQQIVNYGYKGKFKGNSINQYKDWCEGVFKHTMDKFLQIQQEYDEQTQHYCNKSSQKYWESKIVQKINQFYFCFKKRREKMREKELGLQRKKYSRQNKRRISSNSNNLSSYISSQSKHHCKRHSSNNVVKIKNNSMDSTTPSIRFITTTINYRIRPNIAPVKMKLQ